MYLPIFMHQTKIKTWSFFKKLHPLLQTENLDSKENIIVGGDF